MTQTQGDLAGLSRFIFRAPSWYASVVFSLIIAALMGLAAFENEFVLDDAWQGIFFVGIPTVLASIFTPYVDQRLGGQLTPNRASLLALFCELLVVGILTAAGAIAVLTSLDENFVFDTLIVALASIFAVRLLVVMAISRKSLLIASIPASIQTLAGAVLLFIYSGTITYLEIGGPIIQSFFARSNHAPGGFDVFVPKDFLLLGGICVLYAIATWLFMVTIDRPWQNSLGVSVLDFIRGFVGHIAEGSRELEDFFEQLGEEAIVPVSVLSFRREADQTEKARFVLPMIHPGPMGEIGGGNLPERVAENTDGLGFPPHATAGHDFNLVTEREVDTIIAAADRAYERITYDTEATNSHLEHDGELTMLGQSFGNGALLVGTYSPSFADDVEYSVGLSASSRAKRDGLKNVMLVDAHNCNNGLGGADLGHVTPGSKRSFSMIHAADELGGSLTAANRKPLGLGVAWDPTDWTPTDGIGPLGIRVAVVETGTQRTAYVLVDGNNMEPGLRDRIVDRLTATATRTVAADGGDSRVGKTIEHAEVMTTDTHVVNTVEAENQVGDAIDTSELLDRIEDLLAAAIDDIEPVEAGMNVERATVTVFGNDRTETLASHANVMISMAGALAAAFIMAVFAVSVLIFFFT
ncbi:DUF2070 family protein [Halocatena halophila]|uniref:DUF2070 family protein n=1 Tax=Halocatena halophila TaxID=2814576 RepID=UPI002ED6436A